MGVRAEATVSLRDARLPADVDGPDDATGVVLFAHGSGSSRHSPRNVAVARVLQRRRLVTVLVDLLTAEEDALDARTAERRFDIDLLAGRLAGTVDWLTAEPTLGRLPVGLFGASTGAAAALVTAAGRPERIAAVVSRGGRPDLVGPALAGVRAPTLLLVGGLDDQVVALNEQATGRLAAPHELRVVPGAGHLFEEPGTLEQVADAAADWFVRHLPVPA
ncbi:dienelactone hydrolase family protein [Micromonospora sp. WMMD987]|uniref:dienelactone hydrolase family protein n=1 Tax=Micromonospora sp. WMMD987 TaxID=3016089 RepID=UPI00249B88D6|nr:dienelactone hydrolase family protein [Micromonospora sp. WMMD987]WFE96040.1 dienelactone hydrolase family protein [Micromonospora sp. WMMD987]